MGKVTIKINPFGGATVDAEGFAGGDCKNATEAVERILAPSGGGVETEYKPEWNSPSSSNEEEVEQYETW